MEGKKSFLYYIKVLIKFIASKMVSFGKVTVEAFKYTPRKISLVTAGLMGIIQLAFTGTHVNAAVTLRHINDPLSAYSVISPWGSAMFMFLFILSGLILSYAVLKAKTTKTMIAAIFVNLVTITFGTVYSLQMLHNAIYPERILFSQILIIAGIIVYALAIVFYIMQIIMDLIRKKALNENQEV